MTLAPSLTVTERFLAALQTLEQDGSPEQMVEAFREDASVSRLGRPSEQGSDAVRRFWADYRSQFGDRVSSEFRHLHECDDVVTLEWVSTGTLATSRPITYAGISVLTVDGDQIAEFRTYYDSGAFLAEPVTP